MNKQKTVSALEAVLFASGDPISVDRLSQTFEIQPEEIDGLIKQLEAKLDENNSGVKVVRLENTYQLVTRDEFADYIKKAFDIKRRTPLSPASLEVLAVIAYNQPVTRAFIEERGRLELPGRPLLYGTTKTFLRSFSLNDLSDLPPLPKDNPEVNDVGEQLQIEEDITEEEIRQ